MYHQQICSSFISKRVVFILLHFESLIVKCSEISCSVKLWSICFFLNICIFLVYECMIVHDWINNKLKKRNLYMFQVKSCLKWMREQRSNEQLSWYHWSLKNGLLISLYTQMRSPHGHFTTPNLSMTSVIWNCTLAEWHFSNQWLFMVCSGVAKWWWTGLTCMEMWAIHPH